MHSTLKIFQTYEQLTVLKSTCPEDFRNVLGCYICWIIGWDVKVKWAPFKWTSYKFVNFLGQHLLSLRVLLVFLERILFSRILMVYYRICPRLYYHQHWAHRVGISTLLEHQTWDTCRHVTGKRIVVLRAEILTSHMWCYAGTHSDRMMSDLGVMWQQFYL